MGQSRLSSLAPGNGLTARQRWQREAQASLTPAELFPAAKPEDNGSAPGESAQERSYPLSFAQRRLWFLDQLEPGSPLYNMPALVRLKGDLDLPALRQALADVISRHAVLRTRFISADGAPQQRVHPAPGPDELHFEDLSEMPAEEREVAAAQLARIELRRPFALQSDLLLRVKLLRLAPQEHLFVFSAHHIVFDEWSMRIFFRDLSASYRARLAGRPPSLPELSMQYAEYALWQEEEARRGAFDQQLAFWRDQLSGNPPVSELPLDYPRGLAPTFTGRAESRPLPGNLRTALKDLARKSGSSLFLLLLAAFKTLAHRYTQLDDIVVASPIAGRNRLEFEDLIGFFVNTLPLRTRVESGLTFEQLWAKVRAGALAAFANQDIPFDKIVEELRPERSLQHLRFTRLMFLVQNEGTDGLSLPGVEAEWIDAGTDTAKFDATFVVQESREGMRLRVEYNDALFHAETARRWLKQFETLLGSIVANPKEEIGRLNLLSDEERQCLLARWNETSTEYPRGQCVHQLFEAQAAQTPEAPAVQFPDRSFSYRELNERANQLAWHLKGAGVGPGVPVAVFLERSAEMPMAWLAILKAGGAYVPLHHKTPAERLEFMLGDTRPPVLLTQERLLERLPNPTATVFCVDSDWERVTSLSRVNPENVSSPEGLAYIMYTSGSTGQPKGVAIPHRGICRLVRNTNYITFEADDRVAQISNAAFDAATFEVWGALLNGARLEGITEEVLRSPEEFARELRARGITVMFLTAALFNQMAREVPGAFETLRTVIAGGDALDPKWVRAVLAHRPPARLLNGYGPTENTTFSCCHEIKDLPETAVSVPIGRPISNSRACILDAHLQPVPVGVTGELYLGGDGLALGYWNRPELTSERFVVAPFGERLYRTGDRARYLPDGCIEFLGRADHQVKIRGFRVELGEVEAALREHEDVGDCVVIVSGTSAEDKRLVAYFAPAGKRATGSVELRRFLERKLPEYMIPAIFVSLPELPLSPNGKINRAALPAPERGGPTLEKPALAPQDDVERKLARIWEEALGVQPIGVEDNFFDLGGHSLLAVRVITDIEKAFGKGLRVGTVFLAPTILQLAAIIRGEVPEAAVAARSTVVELQPEGTRPTLYLVHGAGGGMFWGYMNLARHLGREQPVCAFKSRTLDGRPELDTIEEMAAQYVADLLKHQPRGPYYLGGYCFGGVVAHQMARQLEARGERVALLVLFDCTPPNSRYWRARATSVWLGQFLRNLGVWAKSFLAWTPSQRAEFFRWKWSRLKRSLKARRGAGGRDLLRLETENFVNSSSFSEEQRKVWAAHLSALARFHPQPVSCPIALFRGPAHPLWCSFAEDCGWSDYTSGPVKIELLPAAHEKILEEPCAGEVAASLNKVLHQAQMQGTAPQPNVREQREESLRGFPDSTLARAGATPEPPALRQEALDYWKRQLEDVPALLELPTDHPRPPKQSGRRSAETKVISPRLAEALEDLARQRGVEVTVVLAAAVSTLLHRYRGQRVILLVLPAGAMRARQTASGALNGHSSEALALVRTNFEDNPTFTQIVDRVCSSCAEGLRYGSVSFEDLIASLCPVRDESYHPIVQVSCGVPFSEKRGGSLPGESEFDLSFALLRNEETTALQLGYAQDLFERATIQRMLGHLETLLNSAMEFPKWHVGQLRLLPEEEQNTLLVKWTETALAFPQDKTVADLFEQQALRTPNVEALVCGVRRFTYGELRAWSGQIAARLKRLGVGEESLVGICLSRSAEMIAALLATHRAGGAYVPLDPAYPKERLAFMLADARVGILITQKALVPSLPETNAHIVCIEDLPYEPNARFDANETKVAPAQPRQLSHVIYTSGSTGQPKGVALEHRSVVALIAWAQTVFTSEELAGVLAATSICFDISVFEIFVPLCLGGKVIVAENALALASLPAADQVRLINTVPSAMRELLRVHGVPRTVRVINLAGEPLSPELVDQVYRETSAEKLYDLYGPTETTTYSTFTLRRPGLAASIGRPLANEQVYLLDQARQLVPIGVPGELYIGGIGLARGYLNRPELTAERFVPHPFEPGSRLYKTGDLARWRADGTLEYLGRIDHQVKIRGFRIELGEIESVLKLQARVGDAVVVAREDRPGNRRLVAYVALKSPEVSGALDELRLEVRRKLPEYMMPSAFVFLPRLPLTPNGKVDRKRLPAPGETEGTDNGCAPEPEPAMSEVEAKLAAIWREVLQVKRAGLHDNFFDLGGHSLLAIQAVARVRETFNVEAPLTALFEAPTLAQMAQALNTGRWKKTGRPAPAWELPPRDAPLPASAVQERLWFLDQMEPGGHAYHVPAALRLKGALDVAALARAFNEVVRRHEALRTTFKFDEQTGSLTQRVHPPREVDLALAPLPANVSVQQWLNAEAQKPFDLTAGPLYRTSLLRLNSDEHVLVTVFHHAIADGWSLGIFFHELEQFYAAALRAASSSAPQLETLLPELPAQPADHAHWQRRWLDQGGVENDLAFWRDELKGAPSAIDLPLDKTGAADTSRTKAGWETIVLPPALLEQMQARAHTEGATAFVYLMAALGILLHKWTQQNDLVIGTVVAGRSRREIEPVMGCFMNFLPIRSKLSEARTGTDVLSGMRETILRAQAHQECPFEKIVEALNPERKLHENPLYNVALLYQNFRAASFEAPGIVTEQVSVFLDAALLDLRFEAEQRPEGLALHCEYRTSCFNPSTVQQLLASFRQVLETLVSAPQTPLQDFALSPELQRQSQLPQATEQTQLLAVAGTFTVEPIEEALRHWLKELALPAELQFAPYNQVFQELLDPGSLLGRNSRGLNVLLVRLEDWQGQSAAQRASGDSASPGSSGPKLIEDVERSADEFLLALKSALTRPTAPWLVCFCPPSIRAKANPDFAGQLERVEQRLAATLACLNGVYVVTPAELARLYPVAESDDPRAEELGQVPYTPLFFTALATMVARKFHALSRPPIKVIVLDCDQTLWSGVCGEDGPENIRLSPPYRALQEFMRAQREAGRLLCVCSKNNDHDVWEVFERRQDMPLNKSHFTASRINWRPKSENLKALARELQLGLDSFVFVDDNPLECAEVEAHCPEALVLQLPEDPESIPHFLEHCWVFDYLKLTAEDRQRAELYQQTRRREQLRAESLSLADFLAGLGLRVEFSSVGEPQVARAAQLTQRTNQFNFTTRRRAESDLLALRGRMEMTAVSVVDRFGDYGVVGLMLAEAKAAALDVDTFLLSCRVLGRGIEHRMLARLGQEALRRNLQWVDLHFSKTDRNKPAWDFLERIGSQFRQPLNGGFLYRIPAQKAAEIVFDPSAVEAAEPAAPRALSEAETPQPERIVTSKFARCRAIALEANDVERIHQAIESRGAATARAVPGAGELAPRTPLEIQLCELWRRLLRLESVGVTDNFFELGGHSLLAVRLFAELERLTGRKLPLVTLFKAPTIEQLARLLADKQPDSARSVLVPLQPKGDKPPLFLVHGAGGDVLWGYANLATLLPADQPIYGIKSRGQLGLEEIGRLEEMASFYLQEIRQAQREGPYLLGGYCFGGNVAYEMARQLQAQGQQVGLVALIDSAPSNTGYEKLRWWSPAFSWRFARNLYFWLDDFARLCPNERRRFIRRKARALSRKMLRQFRGESKLASVDLEQVIDPECFPESELKLWQTHLDALVEHIDQPYEGSVVLLRTRGEPILCSFAEDFGWGRLAQGGVLIRRIPGSHENIFIEPNVQHLAKELTAVLLEARQPKPKISAST